MNAEKDLRILHRALGVEIILAALVVIIRVIEAGDGEGSHGIVIDNLPSFLLVTTVISIGILLAICALAFRVTKVQKTLELLMFSGFVITCGVWFLVDLDYMILFAKTQTVVDCLDDLSVGFLPLFTAAYLSMLLKNRRTRLIMRINYTVLLITQFVNLVFLLLNSGARDSGGVFLFSIPIKADETVMISRPKVKELLALLVDKNGSTVTTGQAICALWEDRPDDDATKALYRMTMKRLKDLLAEKKIDYILEDGSSQKSLRTEEFVCDYYEVLKGNEKYSKKYAGASKGSTAVPAGLGFLN